MLLDSFLSDSYHVMYHYGVDVNGNPSSGLNIRFKVNNDPSVIICTQTTHGLC